MKVFNTIAKLVVALAAIAGAIYVAATYGEQIVAWAKKVMAKIQGDCECTYSYDEDGEEPAEAPVEEPAAEAEEAEEAEEVAEAAPVIPEGEPAASEEDFEA